MNDKIYIGSVTDQQHRYMTSGPHLVAALIAVAEELENKVGVEPGTDGLRGNWALNLLVRIDLALEAAGVESLSVEVQDHA